MTEGEELNFQIERIMGERQEKDGAVSYYIKWLGYPMSESTWETREDLLVDGHSAAVGQYERGKTSKSKAKGGKGSASNGNHVDVNDDPSSSLRSHSRSATTSSSSSSRARSKTPIARTSAAIDTSSSSASAAKRRSSSSSSSSSSTSAAAKPTHPIEEIVATSAEAKRQAHFRSSLELLFCICAAMASSIAAKLYYDATAQAYCELLPSLVCLSALVWRSNMDVFFSRASIGVFWVLAFEAAENFAPNRVFFLNIRLTTFALLLWNWADGTFYLAYRGAAKPTRIGKWKKIVAVGVFLAHLQGVMGDLRGEIFDGEVAANALARAFSASSLVLAVGNLVDTRSIPAVVDLCGAAFSFAFASVALSVAVPPAASLAAKSTVFETWLMLSAMKWAGAVSLCVSALAKSSSGAY